MVRLRTRAVSLIRSVTIGAITLEIENVSQICDSRLRTGVFCAAVLDYSLKAYFHCRTAGHLSLSFDDTRCQCVDSGHGWGREAMKMRMNVRLLMDLISEPYLLHSKTICSQPGYRRSSQEGTSNWYVNDVGNFSGSGMVFSCFGTFRCGRFDRGVKRKTAKSVGSTKYNY